MRVGKFALLASTICLGLAVTGVSAEAQFGNDGASLGLNEKRLMKELVDTNIPEFIASVEKECGVKLKVDVDWNSFVKDEAGLRAFNLDGLEKVSGALGEICSDELGKESIKKALNTYQVKNVKAESKKASFDKGILTLEAGFGAEWSAGAVPQSDIKELIESKL